MTGPLAGPGACDTHLHFYDSRYPTSADAVLFPPDATPDDYRAVQAELGLERLVVVQPTTYGLDNSCQLDAMAAFGDAARGVMVVDATTPTDELRRLTSLGVRGARFHMLTGGAVGWGELDGVVGSVALFGWHIQLQLNGRDLADHVETLLRLPTDLVVDHIGRFMPPVDPGHPGFTALRRLIDAGRTWVKLSAPYESASDHDLVLPVVDALVREFPQRLLWASNWPHPGQAGPPTAESLARMAERWLPTADLRRRVLVDNPADVYGF